MRTRQAERGSAMVGGLVIVLLVAITVAALLRLSAQDVRLTGEHNQYKRAMVVAEAGLGRAIIQLRNLVLQEGRPQQQTLDMLEPPTIEGFSFVSPSGKPAYTISIDGASLDGQALADGRWRGLDGGAQRYLVRVGATDAKGTGVVLRERVQAISLPLCRFEAFCEGDLALVTQTDRLLTGPVHSNGSLYVESRQKLNFADVVRVVGSLYHGRPSGGVLLGGEVLFRDPNGIFRSMTLSSGVFLDHRHPEWDLRAIQQWGGNVVDSAHKVPRLRLPIPFSSTPHQIVERANPGDSALLAAQKFENKAALTLGRDAAGMPQAQAGGASFALQYTIASPGDNDADGPVAYTMTSLSSSKIKFTNAPTKLGASKLIQTDQFVIPVKNCAGTVIVTTKAGGYEASRTLAGLGASAFNESGFTVSLPGISAFTSDPETGPSGPPTVIVGGTLNINPNNSPDNEFTLTKGDGTQITRDNLHKDAVIDTSGVFYQGLTTFIHVKPKGNGNQNTLIVNGVAYGFSNNKAYDITPTPPMTFKVYNDKPQKVGGKWKAMGKWWLQAVGTGATVFMEDGVAVGGSSGGGGAVVGNTYALLVKSDYDTNPLTEVTFDFGSGATVLSSRCDTTGATAPTATTSVSGKLNLNPNNSAHNEFTLTKPDGSVITRDDLHAGTPVGGDGTFYQGGALSIRVKPKGNGNQNTLVVNGTAITVQNGRTYFITGDGLNVRVYNDSVSGGKAMGKWWLETGSAAGKVVDGGEGTTTSTDIVCSVVRTTATGVRRFLTITPFADWREGGGSAKTMHSLDFDMEMFSNCPTRPTQAAVLYAWNDYQKDGCLPAVRILGGGLLPETGLTFATRLPLYVRGNFNSSGQTRPALLCGDAVSLLSAAWDDANSWSGIAGRAAVDTTVKTTVITGDLPLNAAGDAGGFVDILRLCENWTGKTLTYRGAVACLWRSQMALGMTTPGGNTFLRPNWDWAYDAMYRQPASEPPGEPWVVGLESLLWAQDSWSQDEIPQPKSTN